MAPSLIRPAVTISAHSTTSFQYHRSFQNGLLSASPAASSFSAETDIIDPQRTTFSTPPSNIQTSESPSQDPLNFSIASRSSSSFPNSFSTFDSTSFTTDNPQQPWLPSPLPTQPSAQNLSNNNDNNNNNNNGPNSPHEDFVLYPAPKPQHRDQRAPSQLSATPRQIAAAYQRYLLQTGQLPRRHSVNLQQQLAGSPVQVPRLTRLATQSSGYPLSTTLRSSPSSRSHSLRRFAVSNSAPAAPNSNNYHYRPPVPLFNSTTNSPTQNNFAQSINHRRIMSTGNIAQDFFDFGPDGFGDEFATDLSMLSPNVVSTGVMASKDAQGEVPSGTVSPSDLFMDASAPPSASFTDLSTPSFESPGCFSQDTSPMFGTDMDLGPGHEQWDSLFPSEDGMSMAFDQGTFDAAAASYADVKAEPPVSPAVKTVSSPARSPNTSRGSAVKHSTVAGVNARRSKPLPPIKFDEADPVAAKRARNTEAARKSRARKLERQGDMERRISDLQKELEETRQLVEFWKSQAQSLGA